MSSIGQGPTQTEQANSAPVGGNQPVDYSDPSVKRGFSDQNSYSRAAAEEEVKSQVQKPKLESPSTDSQSDAAQQEVLDDFKKSKQASTSEYVREDVKTALKKGVSDGIANAEKQAAEQGVVRQSTETTAKKKTASESNAETKGNPEASAQRGKKSSRSGAFSDATTAASTASTAATTEAGESIVEKFDKFTAAFQDVYVKAGAIKEAPPGLREEIQKDLANFTKNVLSGKQQLDVDSATTMLVAIQAKLQDNRIKFDQETIKIKQVEYDQQFKKSIGKIRESIAEAEKAKTSGLIGKIFGWIAVLVMVIVTVIVAIVGAVFTGGIATGVAVTLMIAALAIVLTMQISSEAGSTWMMDMFGDSKEAKIGAMVFWTALILALSIGGAVAGGFAGGGAGAGGAAAGGAANIASTSTSTGATVTVTAANTAASASSLTAKITSALNNISRILQVVSGAAMIGDGFAQIATSVYNYEAETLRAEALEDRAFMLRLQQAIDDATESIAQAIEELQAGYQVAANIIKANHETKSTLARNLRA